MDFDTGIALKHNSFEELWQLLDKLNSASARHRRGGLALVRTMTSGGDFRAYSHREL
jgi:hypothetical protein